jgi:hypothetical protein
VRNRSGFTQSSDEVLIFASNQIVKDLCGHQRTSCDTRGTTGLETCFAGRPARIRVRRPTQNLKVFEKNYQEGRIPPDTMARAGFCYLSLPGSLCTIPPPQYFGQLLPAPIMQRDPDFWRLDQNIKRRRTAQLLNKDFLPRRSRRDLRSRHNRR